MAENSRMSKLSEKEDECIFSWKLFTGWDFMIGNAETAHNRIASVILGFKEALLEEAEKKRNLRNWRIISLRALVNICVVILLAISAYAVVTLVSRTDDNNKFGSWWRENETTIVVTAISITFPVFFEALGYLEHYHPRKQLRLQLAKIMLLNLLNLYSLIFALFSKIEGMSKELVSLQPTLSLNASLPSETVFEINESLLKYAIPYSESCVEIMVPCSPCNMINIPVNMENDKYTSEKTTDASYTTYEIDDFVKDKYKKEINDIYYDTYIQAENLVQDQLIPFNDSTIVLKEMEKLRNLSGTFDSAETYDSSSEIDDSYTYDLNYDIYSSSNADTTAESSSSTEDSYTTLSNEIVSSSLSHSETPSNVLFNTKQSTKVTEEITELSDYEYVSSVPIDNTFTPTSSSNTRMTSQFDYDGSDSNRENTAWRNYREATTNNINYDTSTNSESITDFSTDHITESSSVISYMTTDTTNDITTNLTPEITTDLTSEMTTDTTPFLINDRVRICPNITFNCSINCDGKNITQTVFISNCVVVDVKCYALKCVENLRSTNESSTRISMINTVYVDEHNRKIYNLTKTTRKKLLKLCWETMFGQELVKLTMMDLVFVVLGTLFLDFFRALFVRYMNRCWCWDLEKKFPQYGDFKIAENILHLINNQGMVWMGMFFSPGLVVLNVFKLMILMYLRSWAVMTCNVPHEVVFRVSKSNNFYLALLLTMLFLCVLPVGYTIVWVKPSWHCGPFSEYDKIYKILTSNIYKILPKSLNFALEYIASPAIVIPLLVLLILIIYYLTSLTNSLREANNDLKIQLRRERTEERRKMFQLADTRRRGGSSSIDNTPFARWKKALPSLPISKSIDSDDRKAMADDDLKDSTKAVKNKGGIFAKIVSLAIDKKPDTNNSIVSEKTSNDNDDETDTDFHESLPKEILKDKDIIITRNIDLKKKGTVEFKTEDSKNDKSKEGRPYNEEKDVSNKSRTNRDEADTKIERNMRNIKNISKKQSSESSNQSKQSDSIGSVIPVITISTTESDDEILQAVKEKNKLVPEPTEENYEKYPQKEASERKVKASLKRIKNCSDLKSLRRQSSVESVSEKKHPKEIKFNDGGHKYQYSL